MRQRFETLLSRVDDLLADHPDEVRAEDLASVHRTRAIASEHPHRQPLRRRTRRRAGSVPAPAAHCLSPVRASRSAQRTHQIDHA